MAGRCVFCSIASGDLAAHVVLDDEIAVAFLDHRPVFKGHCLLAPREHLATLTDLPDRLVGPFFMRARLLAGAIERGLEAGGTLVAINNKISQSVPHLHVHVVPRRRKDGLRGFFWPRTTYESQQEMDTYVARIRAELGDGFSRL